MCLCKDKRRTYQDKAMYDVQAAYITLKFTLNDTKSSLRSMYKLSILRLGGDD